MGLISWEEITKHRGKKDRWVVIDGNVYDVSNWQFKHPGGTTILGHYSGQDATEAFLAFHPDLASVRKYMKAYLRGEADDEGRSQRELDMKKDVEELRQYAFKQGWFDASFIFYFLHLSQIIIADIAAYVVLWFMPLSWSTVLLSLVLHLIAQGQGDWNQHDFGHLSVFKSSFWNRFVHYYLVGFLKGGSVKWWVHLHNQHHAKPNCIGKDPDVRVDLLFVVGRIMPVRVAKERKKSMPFNWQHLYFPAIGPPLLFPVYFQFMNFYYTMTRRLWLDSFLALLYYIKFIGLTYPVLGFWGMFAFYEAIRIGESMWFTWVSQSNHIPMDIHDDDNEPWLPLQMRATCDIEGGFFNDWFTGHLNYQLEHHLFPTMPRHNYQYVVPHLQALCKKYDIPYHVKPLGKAFSDITKSLYSSGELWWATYKSYHLL